MRRRKIYRDGTYVCVDPLTLEESGFVTDILGKIINKILPIGKQAFKSAVEAGFKKLVKTAATKAVEYLIKKPAAKPLSTKNRWEMKA